MEGAEEAPLKPNDLGVDIDAAKQAVQAALTGILSPGPRSSPGDVPEPSTSRSLPFNRPYSQSFRVRTTSSSMYPEDSMHQLGGSYSGYGRSLGSGSSSRRLGTSRSFNSRSPTASFIPNTPFTRTSHAGHGMPHAMHLGGLHLGASDPALLAAALNSFHLSNQSANVNTAFNTTQMLPNRGQHTGFTFQPHSPYSGGSLGSAGNSLQQHNNLMAAVAAANQQQAAANLMGGWQHQMLPPNLVSPIYAPPPAPPPRNSAGGQLSPGAHSNAQLSPRGMVPPPPPPPPPPQPHATWPLPSSSPSSPLPPPRLLPTSLSLVSPPPGDVMPYSHPLLSPGGSMSSPPNSTPGEGIIGVFERVSWAAIMQAKQGADLALEQQLQHEHNLLLAVLQVLLSVARGAAVEADAASDLNFLAVSAQRHLTEWPQVSEPCKVAVNAIAHAVYLVCPADKAELHSAAFRLLEVLAAGDLELHTTLSGLRTAPSPTPPAGPGQRMNDVAAGKAVRDLGLQILNALIQTVRYNKSVLEGEAVDTQAEQSAAAATARVYGRSLSEPVQQNNQSPETRLLHYFRSANSAMTEHVWTGNNAAPGSSSDHMSGGMPSRQASMNSSLLASLLDPHAELDLEGWANLLGNSDQSLLLQELSSQSGSSRTTPSNPAMLLAELSSHTQSAANSTRTSPQNPAQLMAELAGQQQAHSAAMQMANMDSGNQGPRDVGPGLLVGSLTGQGADQGPNLQNMSWADEHSMLTAALGSLFLNQNQNS